MRNQKIIALFYLLIHIGLGIHQLSYSQSFNSYIDLEQSDSDNESLENDLDDIEQDDQGIITQLWSITFMGQEKHALKLSNNFIKVIDLPETPPPIV